MDDDDDDDPLAGASQFGLCYCIASPSSFLHTPGPLILTSRSRAEPVVMGIAITLTRYTVDLFVFVQLPSLKPIIREGEKRKIAGVRRAIKCPMYGS